MQVVIFDFYGVIYDPATSQPTVGLREFVELLHVHGLDCGVASSSLSAHITAFLQEYNLAEYFPVIVGLGEVTHTKPNPECYQAVARAYDAQPIDCVVIDDSLAAITAAKQAGFTVIYYGSGLDNFEKIATLLKL
ncbi:MAG: HAD family phosphatase [Candidatus Kerfeldbacteria bacterium]|nr:HAD family phosphatase [Candidatus Kerfeldbacteria bacterium]